MSQPTATAQRPPQQQADQPDGQDDEDSAAVKLAALLLLIRALIRAFAAAQNRATKAAVKAVATRTDAMSNDDWYDTDAITKYAKDVVTIVEPYQRQMAA